MFTVKELRAEAKRRGGLPKYYSMRKAQLEEALANLEDVRSYVLDELIPEINVPILEPTPYRQLKSFAKKTAKNIDKFADWVISYVPEPIVKVVNKRVEKLKTQVKNIYETIRKNRKKTLGEPRILQETGVVEGIERGHRTL